MIVLINQNYRRCQPCFELLEIKLYGCTMKIFGNYLNSHEMISLENQNIFSLISALLMRHIVLCLGCSERIGCFLFYTSRVLILVSEQKGKKNTWSLHGKDAPMVCIIKVCIISSNVLFTLLLASLSLLFYLWRLVAHLACSVTQAAV